MQEEPEQPRRKIKELGLLEGRERNTRFLHPFEPEVKYDEQEGAYAGRNRKKKKHRRLHAVEVQARKLEESGGLKSDGSLDVSGLLKLAAAQEEREKAPGGVVTQKYWTMEELDLAYPTPEGNVRLGLQTEADIMQKRPRKKYERSSHLINMRAPGAVEGLIPYAALDYRRDWQNTTLFVLGSMGHLYSIVVQPLFSVGAFKEMVWEHERRHRDGAKDLKSNYKVHRQILVLDRGIEAPPRGPKNASVHSGSAARAPSCFILGPDLRRLAWYNITDYDVVRVEAPTPKLSEEEEEAVLDACFNAAYERAINKRLAGV